MNDACQLLGGSVAVIVIAAVCFCGKFSGVFISVIMVSHSRLLAVPRLLLLARSIYSHAYTPPRHWLAARMQQYLLATSHDTRVLASISYFIVADSALLPCQYQCLSRESRAYGIRTFRPWTILPPNLQHVVYFPSEK